MTQKDFRETAGKYDAIADRYQKAKSLPFQKYILEYSLFDMAGPLDGLKVVDLGCGTGYNSRLLKKAGAADVLGVDISKAMVNEAVKAEKAVPLGCRYAVADVSRFRTEEKFDLAVGSFLLNYAASSQQLLDLCRTISNVLRPAGRFIGINSNMALDPERYDDCRKYGRWMTTTPDRREGDVVTIHLLAEDESEIRLDNFYLKPPTYEAAFAEAGLVDFAWQPVRISQHGLNEAPKGYWDDFFAAPPIVGIVARKSDRSDYAFRRPLAQRRASPCRP